MRMRFFFPETAIWICDVLLCILPSCRSCDALHSLHYYVFRRLHSDTSLLLPSKTYPFLLSPAPVKYMYCIFSKCRRMTACCRFQKRHTCKRLYIHPRGFSIKPPQTSLIVHICASMAIQKRRSCKKQPDQKTGSDMSCVTVAAGRIDPYVSFLISNAGHVRSSFCQTATPSDFCIC